MANGQQEQQQLPQVATQQQPLNLYQTLGSLNAPQMLELKHHIGVYKSQQEIKSNVGDDRYMELMSEVNAGNTTLKAAVDRSKNELSPVMNELDAMLYKRNDKGEYTATVEDFMIYRGRHPNMLAKEVNRWTRHRNAIAKKEADQATEELKLREDISAEQKENMAARITNYTYANDAQTDYINLQHAIEESMKPFLQTHELTKAFKTAKVGDAEVYIPKGDISVKDREKLKLLGEQFDYVISELAKDMNPETYNQGDQNGILRSLSAISNLVDADYLRKKIGYINPSTGEMIPTLGKGLDDGTLRRYFLDELSAHVTRGKNHLNKIKPILESRPPGVEAEQPQQGEFPSITTGEEYEALPPGTVFIDPNGNKRTKP